jgi:ATP-binding cassette subfamily C protein CydCD
VVQRGAFAELSAVEGPLREMVERETAGDLLAGAVAR